MTKILVIGAAGRMGRTIVSCIEDTPDVDISGGTENPGNPLVGSDMGELAGIGKKNILVADCLETAVKACDVIIDFTAPDSSMQTLEAAVKEIKPLVIGTTGFSASQKQLIQQAGKKNRCVMAPNMSIGVNVLFKVVRDMAQALGSRP